MATERSMMAGQAGLATVQGDTPQGRDRWTAARLRMAALVFAADRRALLERGRARMARAMGLALLVSCALFGVVVALRPLGRVKAVRVILPPPTRTVILEEVVPEPPAPAEEALRPDLKQVNVREVEDPPAGETPPLLLRREPPTPVDPVAAKAGRERARSATASLDQATASLDRALGDLSSSLRTPGAGGDPPSRRARERNVGSGRSDGQLGAVGDGAAGGATADLGGSSVQGSVVAIGSLARAPGEERAGTDGGTATGSRPGVYRTNASLLAVIQKYAAGIQYCYEAELKRDPGLHGKLVVAMTVTAAGAVSEATVVQNTVGSERLTSCALSQIRGWRFPPVPGGLTTFQAPFVFTPPR